MTVGVVGSGRLRAWQQQQQRSQRIKLQPHGMYVCVWEVVCVYVCMCVWQSHILLQFSLCWPLTSLISHSACMWVCVYLSLSLSLSLSYSAPSTIKLFVVCTLSKMLAGCLRFMLLGWGGRNGCRVGEGPCDRSREKVVYFSCKLHES